MKDLFLHLPRHMAQLGGGEPRSPSGGGLPSSLFTLLGFAPELSSCASDRVSICIHNDDFYTFLFKYLTIMIFSLMQ